MLATERRAPLRRKEDRWLSPAEAAAYIGYSVKTLSNWRALKRGPKWSRLPTGAVRYKLSDLDRWLKGRAP